MARLELTLTGNLSATVQGDANVEITNRVLSKTLWRSRASSTVRRSNSNVPSPHKTGPWAPQAAGLDVDQGVKAQPAALA